MLQEDHLRLRLAIASTLAQLGEALLDVLAAAAGGAVEVYHHERPRRLGPLHDPRELILRLELPHAVYRANILLLRFSAATADLGIRNDVQREIVPLLQYQALLVGVTESDLGSSCTNQNGILTPDWRFWNHKEAIKR